MKYDEYWMSYDYFFKHIYFEKNWKNPKFGWKFYIFLQKLIVVKSLLIVCLKLDKNVLYVIFNVDFEFLIFLYVNAFVEAQNRIFYVLGTNMLV